MIHLALAAAIGGAMYLVLIRTRLDTWVVAIGGVLMSIVAQTAIVAVRDEARGGLVIAVELAVLVAALVLGGARRVMRTVANDLRSLQPSPVGIRADGAAAAAHVESLGFEATPERWQHFPTTGWDWIALRDGPVNAVVLSGEKGPAFEFSTVFENGMSLVTAATGRDRLPATVVRQCFRGGSVDDLLREHRRALGHVSGAGGPRPRVVPLDELASYVRQSELAQAKAADRRILGSVVRELRHADLDAGSIADRPRDVERLLRPLTGA